MQARFAILKETEREFISIVRGISMSDERATNAIDRQLGVRLRKRRLELGMSQEALADRIGITFQQIQKYENGINRISASRLVAIAAALQVPVSMFYEDLTFADIPSAAYSGSSLTDHVLASREGHKLMQLFGSITNSRVRRKILNLAQAIADEGTD